MDDSCPAGRRSDVAWHADMSASLIPQGTVARLGLRGGNHECRGVWSCLVSRPARRVGGLSLRRQHVVTKLHEDRYRSWCPDMCLDGTAALQLSDTFFGLTSVRPNGDFPLLLHGRPTCAWGVQ